MNERLFLLVLVIGSVLIVGWSVRTWGRKRQQQAVASVILPENPAGSNRIVAFYGPSCDACERQKAILGQLESELANRVVIELRDATVDYDYARQFGLMVVPTTVVIRPDGGVAGINSGFTSRAKLESQLVAA